LHSVARRSRNLLRHARVAGNVIRLRRRLTVGEDAA
jgi:hypothetical protein